MFFLAWIFLGCGIVFPAEGYVVFIVSFFDVEGVGDFVCAMVLDG